MCLLKGTVKKKVREKKKVMGKMSRHILGMRCQKGYSFFITGFREFLSYHKDYNENKDGTRRLAVNNGSERTVDEDLGQKSGIRLSLFLRVY